LNVDLEGGVEIVSDDPVAEWKTIDVIKAIGRGFDPRDAYKLFDENHILRIINLKEIFHKEKQRRRHLGRIIGRQGKAKKKIEEMTGAKLCIYGNTVSIIGLPDEVRLAERAIDMLLRGVGHGAVYGMLKRESLRMG